MHKYILAIDQSTQGTKALIYDENGRLRCRKDKSHRQLIDENGYIEHDMSEIIDNVKTVVWEAVRESGIDKNQIVAAGISNQRETLAAWDKITGEPLYHAIVWQCARGRAICEKLKKAGFEDKIKEVTGLALSPYFSAAKASWLMEHAENIRKKSEKDELCFGTMDSWVIYKMTEKVFKTDYSNASRTQLFDIQKLCWSKEMCKIFHIKENALPQVCDSDAFFGDTDLFGLLEKKIPIHSVLGDSHGALFGQGCLISGMVKATYGTGSSIMMNIGEKPVISKDGLVTSIGFKIDGQLSYVLEGNINYTGAVISWMKDDLGLIENPNDTEVFIQKANPQDTTYLVPAFSGLGAPYWDDFANAAFVGMTRTTKKAELIKAGVESIAYQINDIVEAMKKNVSLDIITLRVDGGPTKNNYLMQFQSDLIQGIVSVSKIEELSATGVAYAAGIAIGLYKREDIFQNIKRIEYKHNMSEQVHRQKMDGWHHAIEQVLQK